MSLFNELKKESLEYLESVDNKPKYEHVRQTIEIHVLIDGEWRIRYMTIDQEPDQKHFDYLKKFREGEAKPHRLVRASTTYEVIEVGK